MAILFPMACGQVVSRSSRGRAVSNIKHDDLASYPTPEPRQSQQAVHGVHKHAGAKCFKVLQVQEPQYLQRGFAVLAYLQQTY